MAWDFWRGGVHVLNPDWDIVSTRFAQVVGASDEIEAQYSELGRKLSNFEWISSSHRSFLWKHEREGRNQYDDRCARLVHLPIFQAIVDIYTAAVLRTNPTRENVVTGPWTQYHQDVDLIGTNINAFMRQCLALGLVFGRLHSVTDKIYSRYRNKSLREKRESGERSYSQILTPLSLVDWNRDDFGSFVWAVVKEIAPDPRNPGDDTVDPVEQYRVWYRDGWELYRGREGNITTGSKYLLIDGDTHDVGEVPISTLWLSKDVHHMLCESPHCNALDFDRRFLNRLSELDELERVQAFAVFCIPVTDGQEMESIDIGPSSALTVPSDAGMPQFVSPDNSIAQGKWERLQAELFSIRQLEGIGRGRAEYSKEERSAEAISVESEDKRNQLAWYAEGLEEFDKQLHRHVALWEGEDEWPQAKYPRNFDVKGLLAQINELVMLQSTKALSKMASAEITKPIVKKILTDGGVDVEVIDKVMSSIDEELKKEPEVLTFSQSQDENGESNVFA
jgi:hypothetical protein